MKKLLFIFLTGQLLLLSYIFNQSVYQIYELNNIGDPSLEMYMVNDSSSDKLQKLYQLISEDCLTVNKCNLQLVKTPISENQKVIYDIYHSQIQDIKTPPSIRPNNVFNYLPLTQEDFVDSNGVFYTDISLEKLSLFEKQAQLVINSYNNIIEYKEIIKFNLFNFIVFLIISQLILFIYTFTRIKTNSIKKVLGYSEIKMISSSLKSFLLMEIVILVGTNFLHFIYYWISGHVIGHYFYLLLLFLVIVILLNVIMFLVTQISLKFIDIPTMMKNKVYSNKLNYGLYTIKIMLILAITVSTSILFSDYKDYKIKVDKLSEYKKLDNYFTAIGFNSDEFEKVRNNVSLSEEYGKSVKDLYVYFDNRKELYVLDASQIIGSLSSFWLEVKGKSREEVYSDLQLNYIIVNARFLENLMELKNDKGTIIKVINQTEPTILVPVLYKSKETEIKEVYIEKYNNFLNYDEIYEYKGFKKQKISDLNIIYIENNQDIELLGKNLDDDGSEIKLKNTIIMLDQGNFGSQYYYTQLNQGDIIFNLVEREDFSQALGKFNLNKLVIAGSLLTPFMNSIHNAEFLMHNSLVFTILFMFTLIFIMYISNYVDIISNSKKYAMQYIFGYGLIKTFKSNLVIYLILLTALAIDLYWDFNSQFYMLILITDFLILLILYKNIVKRDIHKLVKGG